MDTLLLESATGNKAGMIRFLGWWRHRLRMRVAIMFDSQAQNEGEQDKSNDALFLSSENETLPQRIKS